MQKKIIGFSILCLLSYYLYLNIIFSITISNVNCLILKNNNFCSMDHNGCKSIIYSGGNCDKYENGSSVSCVIMKQKYMNYCKVYSNLFEVNEDMKDYLVLFS